MALTDIGIRTAKPQEKSIKMTDGGGLYLLLNTNGSKWWRLDYRFDGKRKTLSVGVYPEISLKDARERRDAARKLLADGVDPGAQRKAAKATRAALNANSFEIICREWLENKRSNIEEAQYKKALARLEKDVFPWMGKRPIAEITAPETKLGPLLKLKYNNAIADAFADLGAPDIVRKAFVGFQRYLYE